MGGILSLFDATSRWQCLRVTLKTLAFLCIQSTCEAQSTNTSPNVDHADEPLTIERAGTMVPVFGAHYRLDLDLGSLPELRRVKVNVRVQNPTNNNFRVFNSTSNCKCSSIKSDGDVIAANSDTTVAWELVTSSLGAGADPRTSVVIRLEFESPGKSSKFYYGVEQTASTDINSSLQFRCSYELSGALGFPAPSVFVEVPESQRETQIVAPFTITEPLKFEELSLDVADSISWIDWKIARVENQPAVIGKLGQADCYRLPVSGYVRLQSFQMPKMASLRCVVRAIEPVSVSPAVVTLQREEDDFRANWIVRLVQRQQTVAGCGISIQSTR